MIINFSNTNGGGGDITVDSQMSDTSTNAVQNKVIKEYVDQHSGGISQLTVNPKQMFESFDVYLNLIDGKFHWNGFDNDEIVDAEHEYYLYNTYLPDSLDNKNFNLSYYPEGTVLTPIYPVSIKDTDGKVYYAYNPNISVLKVGVGKECIFSYKLNDFVCELHLVRDGDSQHLKDAFLIRKAEKTSTVTRRGWGTIAIDLTEAEVYLEGHFGEDDWKLDPNGTERQKSNCQWLGFPDYLRDDNLWTQNSFTDAAGVFVPYYPVKIKDNSGLILTCVNPCISKAEVDDGNIAIFYVYSKFNGYEDACLLVTYDENYNLVQICINYDEA